MQLQVYQANDKSVDSSDNFFNTYKDALTFLKHETTILTDEKISDTKGN